jgi:pimeloyl-ACP methyl ester carboxylesterase
VNVTTPDGRTLVVRDTGDPNGFPVLAHHGTPSLGLLYEPWIADAERRGIRLLAYDRPGYGDSTRSPGRSIADCARDVEAIADALQLERLATWGISGGGPHALACAALLPGRVAAAAAVGSPAPYDADGLDWGAGMGVDNIAEFEAAVAGASVLEPFLRGQTEGLEEATGEDVAAAIASLLAPVDQAVLVGGAAGEHLAETLRGGVAGGPDGWLDDDLAFVADWGFELATIGTPVLIRHGEQDRFVPVAHARWNASHVAGAEARITEHDGHLTLYESGIPGLHEWLLSRSRG